MKIVTITGPAGSGKTTILNELATARGLPVLVGKQGVAKALDVQDSAEYLYVDEVTYDLLKSLYDRREHFKPNLTVYCGVSSTSIGGATA